MAVLIFRGAPRRPPRLVVVGTSMKSAHRHSYRITRRNKYTQNLQDYSRGFNFWILKAAGGGGRVSGARREIALGPEAGLFERLRL